MAKTNNLSMTLLSLILLFSSSLTISQALKETHLHFYFQDVVNGANATSVLVATASNTSTALSFGSTSVIDDALTTGPELNSTVIGKAQGIYAVSTLSSDESALTMVMNFVFTSGKYNGSALSILGRNSVLKDTREMPVIGGTKRFRFARGYALASTYSSGLTGDTTVEYDVYVLH